MTEEQQNLSRRERRAQAKGKGKTSEGAENEDIKDRNQRLRAEAAARRRKAREAERKDAVAEGLAAGERVDDALARSADATGRFLRNNFAWLQWILVLGVAAAIGILIFDYRQSVTREKHGALISSIIMDQFGKVASAEPVTPSDPRLVDPRSEFADEAAQEKAAIDGWNRLISTKKPSLQLSGFLGRAGALYDAAKYADARSTYEKALAHAQINLYPQMKGRALEGIGLTLEAEKKYPEAKKAFEKLGNLELEEFKTLHAFHVARLEYLLGNEEKAKEMLEKLDAKLSAGADARGPTDYAGAAVRDLLKTVDPSRAAAEQAAVSAEQLQRLIEQMQQQGGGPKMPGLPEMPEMPSLPELPEGLMEMEGETPAEGESPQTAPAPQAPAPPAPAPPAPAPQRPVPSAPAPAPSAPAPQTAPAIPKPTAPAPAPVAPAPAPEGATP